MEAQKMCPACATTKPASDFYVHGYKTKLGMKQYLSSRCRGCTKKQVSANKKAKWDTKYRAYFADYNKHHNQHVTGRKKLLRDWLKGLKSKPCIDCRNPYPPECMDFDHRDPAQKTRGIASMIGAGQSRAAIETEIAKCDLVCANCHRTRTARMLGWL